MEKPIDEKKNQNQMDEKKRVESPDSFLHREKIDSVESQQHRYYDEEEDSDIKVVNELAAVEDDPNMPAFTLRSLLVGGVSSSDHFQYYRSMFTKN